MANKTTNKKGKKPKTEKSKTIKKKVVDEKKLLEMIDNNKKMEKDDLNEKVELLTADLDDIISDKTKKDTVVETKKDIKTKKVGVEWLEEQIEGLTKEVADYEEKYLKLKNKHDELLLNKDIKPQQITKQVDPNIKKKIISIYNELLNSYTGKNPSNKKWTNVRIDYLLNKFKDTFDFI